MKKIIAISACFFLFISTYGQSKISGIIKDANENKPVYNAVVSLITPKDSILFQFTRTDSSGNFILKNVPNGNYILMASQPYYADLLDNIAVQKDEQIAPIKLISKGTLLKEIIVKSGSPLHIKGDTTVYTADSFKVSANANVEELLKKLPGIQVDKDGTIKAMGETVQKVLVDGEEFFGDDPGMAVKNLRADAVKEVQVFDKKSDQAEFTGIDDGKTQKTINLKLKDNSKHGYFGKIDVAAGPQAHIENRYNDNVMFSTFKGKRKLSAFLLNGNTGQDRLSWQDEQKYGGMDMNMEMSDDGMVMFFGGENNDDEPYVDPSNGFMTNVNAGIQYSNKWMDKYNFNFTPKYNDQQYTNHIQSFTQTQVGDSVLNQNSSQQNNVNRHNFKVKGVWDLKLDSMNSLKITANTNFYHTESENTTHSVTSGNTGTLKNSSDRNLNTNSDKSAISGNLLFKHKFNKKRRTLSVSADWDLLDNKGITFLKSQNQSYLDGLPAGRQDLDQKKNYEQNTKNLGASLIYTEPLSKEYSLELGYRLAYNYGTNQQLTNTYSPVSSKYDEAIDSLSNNFKQNILQNIPSAKINFANKKWKINGGAGFGFTAFQLKDVTYNKDYDRNYVNFYPNATATYTYKANHSIRFSYNGNTTQPTINQLQPLRNNNDYYNQYIGNPDLKPSFNNRFSISHNSYNFLKDMYSYLGGGINFTSNSITNNQIINIDSGKTITKPINVNGNISANFYSGFGFKIKKIDTRFNFNPEFYYSKYVGMINNEKSVSKTFSPTLRIYMSKSKEKKYDVTIGNTLAYNSSVTSQNNNKIQYYTNDLSFNGTLYLKKVWSISTDYDYYFRQKTFQTSTNLVTHIWNARFQRTFKNDEFTTYISVNDLLNQNVGIDRNFYGNTYSEVRNERLKRYFLIGFTWNFKNKSSNGK